MKFQFASIFSSQLFPRIENESDNYRLWVGGYTGNATDSLSAHNGYPFSTVDRNNDEAPKCCPCAPAYGGGWWFYRFKFDLFCKVNDWNININWVNKITVLGSENDCS